MKYIEAKCIQDPSEIRGVKTFIWNIVTKNDETPLGVVKWYSPWRKYCFFPEYGTIFEEICMEDICEFIVKNTMDQKLRRLS